MTNEEAFQKLIEKSVEERRAKLPTHRMRRGKLVAIPEEWRGNVTTPQTIRKRKSKKGQGRRFKRKCVR